ncbi:MAG: M24 family metallopeptidase [Chlamydiales bacterium]
MRIEKLMTLVEQEKIDALVVDQVVDIYYLTGLDLSLGRLWVTPQGATLFVDGRYIEECRLHSPIPVELTQGYGEKSTFFSSVKSKGKRLGFDTAISYESFRELEKLEAKLVPLEAPVMQLRLYKEEEELEKLQRAADLGVRGFKHILEVLEEGISETELAIELEVFWKREGARHIGFDPIIAFGANSSKPHYRSGARRLAQGDIVLIDLGVVLDHYHSDMTRVHFFGDPAPEMKQIYAIVKEAQARALATCAPGVEIKRVDLAARNYIAERGFGEQFIHSLGHGLGLEVHESPRLFHEGKFAQKKLEPGMVLTIEPGIYLPGKGGVRLEDTVVITKNGYHNLTNCSL